MMRGTKFRPSMGRRRALSLDTFHGYIESPNGDHGMPSKFLVVTESENPPVPDVAVEISRESAAALSRETLKY